MPFMTLRLGTSDLLHTNSRNQFSSRHKIEKRNFTPTVQVLRSIVRCAGAHISKVPHLCIPPEAHRIACGSTVQPIAYEVIAPITTQIDRYRVNVDGLLVL